MRKALGFVLAGLGAVSLTSAATAASQKTNTMSVPLVDGSVAEIEYVGDVPPKVRIAPRPFWGMAPFGLFDRGMMDLRRQIDAMMRGMQALPVAGTPGMNVAAYGDMPAGATSVSVVSTSNGGRTCTRTTEVTSQGPGKPPKVVSKVSGDCAAAPGERGAEAPTA